jgi:hypothetical protein
VLSRCRSRFFKTFVVGRNVRIVCNVCSGALLLCFFSLSSHARTGSVFEGSPL